MVMPLSWNLTHYLEKDAHVIGSQRNELLGLSANQEEGFEIAPIAWFRGEKYSLFVWKDDELEDAYYKDLLYKTKQQQNMVQSPHVYWNRRIDELEAAMEAHKQDMEIRFHDANEGVVHLETAIVSEKEEQKKDVLGLYRKVFR